MESKAFILSNLWDVREGTKWEPQCTFERKKAGPLDKYSLFNGLSSAEDFVANNGVAYPGQMITVIDEALSSTSVYTIQIDGTLKQVDAEGITYDFASGLSADADNNVGVKCGEGLTVDTDNKLILDFSIDCGGAQG